MKIAGTLCLLVLTSLSAVSLYAESELYVNVADFVGTDGSSDVADGIQKIIDDNPNRTLFFPDGTYVLSHSLVTPAALLKAEKGGHGYIEASMIPEHKWTADDVSESYIRH